ncbi:leucine-rich repeat-containing protein 63 isoform X5 [Mauremys reevesii]|uniref:leucine-rich repeat-containing protein 63 isoform X5 n=1 Tax=Mauremys reevesii TaxID=260615 RepID=UPI00193F14F5|nr:leucine-rich repeat-containing protein 63 isoform X5 [Mauremys reevesii]
MPGRWAVSCPARIIFRPKMLEQPKLLRRPLPPKLLPELPMPRENTYKGRIPGKHRLGVIRSTNDEDSNIFSSSYFSGQTQVQPKDAHLLLDQNSSGQTQVHPKDTHVHLDQNLKKELTVTAPYFCTPAGCTLQKDGRSSDMDVLAPPEESDSVYRSLPDIATAASTTDKDRITLSGYYSSSRTSVQLKVQNLFPDQILKKGIITPTSSGPASFPLHKRRKSFRMQLLGLPKDEPAYFTLPEFTFGSLAAVSSSHPSPVMATFRKPVVSHCNYQKLTAQLTSKVRKSIQTEVNTTVLSDNEFPVISQRKPERQSIIEMALEEKMRKSNSSEQILEEGDEGKGSFTDNLKLYTHGQNKKVSSSEPDLTLDDDTIKGIQGFGYQNFLSEHDEQEQLMARSRMAVLYCIMHSRNVLNLKGYFLTLLPDLTPLVDTLVYLNLSFNDLHFFPREVYNIKNLEVLKLRNNPIKEIPDDVHRLKTLRILNMSFNLLSVLPTGMEPAQLCTERTPILRYLQNRKKNRISREHHNFMEDRLLWDITRISSTVLVTFMEQLQMVEHCFWARETTTDWWDRIVIQADDEQWLQNFRMCQATFLDLCAELAPALQRRDTRMSAALRAKKQVAVSNTRLLPVSG